MKQVQHTEMLGSSPTFVAVLRASRLVAVTDATVLIQGESGVGKELLAKSIHDSSLRANGPFVPVNCAALSETLVESELFGHTRGAFTGALNHRVGRIAAANKGTLFLDEIGDMPLAIQAKMLRFLENGECQPLGQERPRHVDTRVIAATNRNLAAMVTAGQFRQDLFYRLHVILLVIPPLRERGHDVEVLARAFLHSFSALHHTREATFSHAAMRIMHGYAWPGNVRELRNLCDRGAIFHPGQEISADFVQGQLSAGGTLSAAAIGRTITPNTLPLDTDIPLPDDGFCLNALERNMIIAALKRTGGNRTHAAKLLNLSRDTLLYRMKKHALR